MKLISKTTSKGRQTAEILSSVLLICVIIFTAYVMLMNARGKAVSVFGYSVLQVVTGSMEPTINTGEFIFVKKVPVDSLGKGDIIAYYTEDEEIKDFLVTHRIIGVNEDGSFITQGDANPVPDDLSVRASRVLGKYQGKARFFGMIGSFADRQKLIFALVIVPIFLLSIFEIRSLSKLWKKLKNDGADEEPKTAEDEIERIKKEAVEEYIKQRDKETDGKEE